MSETETKALPPEEGRNIREEARKLFAQPCECLLAAAVPEQFPAPSYGRAMPEVAFIGRSNVGKSSLINALTGRNGLARASNTPGRTQQIVFFDLAHKLMLVDLPGYGHAKAPKQVIVQWNGLIRHYLRTRQSLLCVNLLVDSRHGLMASDLEMMGKLDVAAVSYQIILTKIDKISVAEKEAVLIKTRAALKKHPAARPEVLLTSSEKGLGISDLQDNLAAFV